MHEMGSVEKKHKIFEPFSLLMGIIGLGSFLFSSLVPLLGVFPLFIYYIRVLWASRRGQ
jgi:hypothetical protein